MDQRASRVRVEDIESAIAEVGEIKAARVVADAQGVIREIHVLALPTKQPKQLVRDIESVIMARFGIPVDHRTISIALLGSDAVESAGAHEERPTTSRPRIRAVNFAISGLEASAAVTLEIAGVEYAGTAKGPASQTERVRQLAIATLDALDKYLGGVTTFALEDVTIVPLGREKVAVACVTLVSRFGEQCFTGSAVVRQSDNDTIVRAILDAINRRLGLLKTA